MCQHFNSCTYGGGKNRKADKHRGRPSGEVPKKVLEHAIQSAPDQLVPQDDPEPILFECATTTTEPLCPICTQILDRPIQLVCGTIICLRCCVSWIQYHHPPLSCPCCYFQLDSAHIRPPPPLVLSLVDRWFKAHNVHIAGERRQREMVKQIVGDNVAAERGAFSFPSEKGGEVIKKVPFVYVPNLIRKISDIVYEHERQVVQIVKVTLIHHINIHT